MVDPRRKTGLCLACLLLLAGGCSPGGSADSGAAPDAAVDLILDLAAPDRAPPDLSPTRPDGKLNLGHACAHDAHCSTGLVCDTSQPGGICTRSCKAHQDCGLTSAGCHKGSCRPLCSPRAIISTCRTDHVCLLDGTKGFCVGSCTQVGCQSGWTCDKDSGLCVNPKAGGIGAACGLSIGTCEGTPNGICILLSSNYKAFCTVPCAPFTKACPAQFGGAYCAASKPDTEYCVFVCDPQNPDKPKCPSEKMSCVTVAKDYSLCLPPS